MKTTVSAAWQWVQNISREIFEQKYMLHGEEDILEVFRLIAEEAASPEGEDSRNAVREQFFSAMSEGRLVPAGRILANARPDSPMKNYNNCFTIDIEDSLEGIYDSLKEDSLIGKMGGGVGFDVSKLRPKGSPLSGGGESSGVVSFLRIFDQSAKTIMTGGHRRSAHIALLDISHPDIEEFITVKQGDRNKELTQFNISVKVTDAFIQAVEEDADWDLSFGGEVYKTLPARELYDLLATNAFYHNEPGIFNTDLVEKYNNGYWAFKMDRVNPCGELVMPPYSLCCLSALNLTAFVRKSFTDKAEFDWEAFEESAAIGVRFLDNILDVTAYPLKKIEDFSKQWRRVGLGFTGLGDALCMMGLVYGEEDSLAFAEELGRRLRDSSYSASAELAAEKGAFPACEVEKLLKAEFIKTLPKEIRNKIKNNGLRNIGLNTIAPTGTTSLTAGQNCSSGIEPIFSLQYTRTIRTGKGDETRTEEVYDYAWLKYLETIGDAAGGSDNPPDFFITAADVPPKKSIDMQAVLQKYIDHSISKTLNLAPGTTLNEYKDLYMYAYKQGLKGFTTFNPEGSMKGILETTKKAGENGGGGNGRAGGDTRVIRRYAPKRPKSLPCDIHSFKGENQDYIILVGKLNGSLYEIFVIDNPEMFLDLKKYKEGRVEKVKKNRYDLVVDSGPVHIRAEDFTNQFNSPNASLARFVSMALRHGTPLQFIADQLIKDSNFLDAERGISRVLKKYIRDGERVLSGGGTCPECSIEGLAYKEGCISCTSCGWSKCS